jgi:hypothetical protein
VCDWVRVRVRVRVRVLCEPEFVAVKIRKEAPERCAIGSHARWLQAPTQAWVRSAPSNAHFFNRKPRAPCTRAVAKLVRTKWWLGWTTSCVSS